MKFVYPLWLTLLPVLGIFMLWMLWDEKKRKLRAQKFALLPMFAQLSPELDFKARLKKSILLGLSIAFGCIALARPQWGAHEEAIKTSSLDLIIALDVSRSMEVEDVVPSRLQKAKHFIRSLVSRMQGDRVGLVGFADSSYVSSPLTTDTDYILDMLEVLDSSTVQSQGTDVGSALEVALHAMDRGAQESGQTSGKESPSRVILLISDGEDHEGQTPAVVKKLKEAGIKLYVLGVGTEKGGPIPVRNASQEIQGYKRDSKGQIVLSQFHSEFLSELAQKLDGRYWSMTPSEAELDALWSELNSLVRGDYEQRKFLVYEERFQIPLFISLLLLLLELSIPARRVLKASQSLILFFLFLQIDQAWAGPTAPSAPSLDLYLQNKRGMRSYDEGRLEDAQKEFGSAQARDPYRPEPEFNQGVVQLQQGDVDQAIESFKKSAKLSEKDPRFSVKGKSMYNLGKAYSKKGEYREAIQSYRKAIEDAQQRKDLKLEELSRKSLELLLKQKQQQQQQQQQQKEKQKEEQTKDQDSQDQKESQKNQDQQGQSKQDQKGSDGENKKSQSPDEKEEKKLNEQKEQSQGSKEEKDQNSSKEILQQNPKQKFDSQKMTVDDANRVMDELRNRERELQEKLQKKNAKSQDHSKDW